MNIKDFDYDRKRMALTLQNIIEDLLKHPGQTGLDYNQKFALTMLMLARLNAVIVAGHSPSQKAASELLKLLEQQTRREQEIATAHIEAAKLLGFGTTVPWSIINTMLEEDD